MAAVLAQEFRHFPEFDVMTMRCEVQRRMAVVILGIDSALQASSKSATLLRAARCKGVSPSLFLALARASLASSNSATSLRPFNAAQCKDGGVGAVRRELDGCANP
jgi:hypothetical protein